MAVFIASDIHGTTYGERLDDPALAGLSKSDYLVVCGDLGMIDADEQLRAQNIEELEAKPYTTLFVDGNHEEFDVLERYPIQLWNGGKVHRISDSVLHLMRGQVFEIAGRTYFTMGGAPTFHKARLLGLIDGPDPGVPTDEEYQEAEANLTRHGWRVNFVLTHSAPTGLVARIPERTKVFPTDIGDWLEELSHKLVFDRWLFGHYHCDHKVDERFRCLFNMIYEVETGRLLREPLSSSTPHGSMGAVPLPHHAD